MAVGAGELQAVADASSMGAAAIANSIEKLTLAVAESNQLLRELIDVLSLEEDDDDPNTQTNAQPHPDPMPFHRSRNWDLR